jgi:hypothetical protein
VAGSHAADAGADVGGSGPAAEARPLEPDALLIVATLVSDDDQVTADVRFCAELSL